MTGGRRDLYVKGENMAGSSLRDKGREGKRGREGERGREREFPSFSTFLTFCLLKLDR